MIKYELIIATTQEDFNRRCNSYSEDGWEPAFSPFTMQIKDPKDPSSDCIAIAQQWKYLKPFE